MKEMSVIALVYNIVRCCGIIGIRRRLSAPVLMYIKTDYNNRCIYIYIVVNSKRYVGY